MNRSPREQEFQKVMFCVAGMFGSGIPPPECDLVVCDSLNAE